MFLNNKYVIPAILAVTQTQAIASMAAEQNVSSANAIGVISKFLATPMIGRQGANSCSVNIASQSANGIVVNISIRSLTGNYDVQVPFTTADKRFSKLSANGALTVSIPYAEKVVISGQSPQDSILREIQFYVFNGERTVRIISGKETIETCSAQ